MPEEVIFRGERWHDGTVHVYRAGRPFRHAVSCKVKRLSATGFDWGVPGFGASQLALALLLSVLRDRQRALALVQVFAEGVVAKFPPVAWAVSAREIQDWCDDFQLGRSESRWKVKQEGRNRFGLLDGKKRPTIE